MKQIILSNGETALVSDEDFDEVSKYSWHLESGYARTVLPGNPRKHIFLHHFIMGKPLAPLETHHKDLNKLNCQRENIIKATKNFNQQNKNAKHIHETGNGRFRVNIKANYKCHTKVCNTLKEAQWWLSYLKQRFGAKE